jgi:hypothetical protein
MPKNQSVSTYRSGKQNCAQSLYTGFQDLLQVSGETIQGEAALQGGNAQQRGGGKM